MIHDQAYAPVFNDDSRFSHANPPPPHQLLHEQDLRVPRFAPPILTTVQQVDDRPHEGTHSECLRSDSVLPILKLELTQGLGKGLVFGQ